jgi:hypothetical protein
MANIATMTELLAARLCRRRPIGFDVRDRVIFRPEIPTGVTGKLQRTGPAQALGLA